MNILVVKVIATSADFYSGPFSIRRAQLNFQARVVFRLRTVSGSRPNRELMSKMIIFEVGDFES
jgi:hypothetical protein